MIFNYKHHTLLGDIFIQEENGKLTGVYLGQKTQGQEAKTSLIAQVMQEIDEYLLGKRQSFTVPIQPKGTQFQQQIWQELQKIPYGTTISYKELAIRSGHPKAFRAAGGACNKNPLLLVIPCHRVIGANQSLIGFGCGLEVKHKLLQLEQTGILP